VNGVFEIAAVDSVDAYQINEQLRDFPGVRIKRVPQRINLVGSSMAHVLGHLGLPTEVDLEERPGLDPNTRIGKLGVERIYDEWLQGRPGELAYRVQRAQITEQRPEVSPPGQLGLSHPRPALQEAVERALAEGVELSNEWKADQRRRAGSGAQNVTERGAVVVLDVRTGAISAMASYPSFDPGLFVGGLDARTFAALNESGALRNLAVSGLYPPASTFKAVTYMTILEENVPLPGERRRASTPPVASSTAMAGSSCRPCPTVPLRSSPTGTTRTIKGWLDLSGALEQSCNIFFWSAALGMYQAWDGTPRETALQDMARDLGYGSRTGIDLTGDAAGIVPDRELFLQWQEQQLEDPDAPRLLDAARLETSDPWFGGDLMNAAIGQGSLVATPLQVAVSYAAMVNGGTVWTPYVVDQIRDSGRAARVRQRPTWRTGSRSTRSTSGVS
jgi:penicillin-binding protein 2